MIEWASDGALFGAGRQNFAALPTKEVAKEVAILAGASMLTAGSLSALAAYNYKNDPKTGMPQIGPLGLDTVVGLGATAASLFLGDMLGETAQTALLGVGLGGLNSAAISYGAAIGVQAASSKGFGQASRTAGNGKPGALNQARTAGLSPEAQRVYSQYVGR